jgi:hypothetical protein
MGILVGGCTTPASQIGSLHSGEPALLVILILINMIVILHARFAVELLYKCVTTRMMERIQLLISSNNGHLIVIHGVIPLHELIILKLVLVRLVLVRPVLLRLVLHLPLTLPRTNLCEIVLLFLFLLLKALVKE